MPCGITAESSSVLRRLTYTTMSRSTLTTLVTPVASFEGPSTAGYNGLTLLNCGNQNSPAPVSGYFDNITVASAGNQSVGPREAIGYYGNNTMATDNFAPSGVTEPNMCASTGKTYNGKTWALLDWSIAASGGFGMAGTDLVDFNEYYGQTESDYATSYLFTYITNPSSSAITNAQLSCGTDDGVKVWLNGNNIWTNDASRGLIRDQDHVENVTLNPGVNRLLVKVTQGTGGFAGQARLAVPGGANLVFTPSDDTAPTGSIQINGGAADTSSPNVTLTASATDDLSGVETVCFSNDNVTYSTPVAYSTSGVAWRLAGGATGDRIVYAKFYDNAGNSSAVVSAPINLTGNPPNLILVPTPAGGGTVAGGGGYWAGDLAHLVATTNPGYQWAAWTSDPAGLNVVSTNATHDYLMPSSDTTLYAQFSSIYTITATAVPTAGGSVTGGGSFVSGSNCSLTATPASDYSFSKWTSDSAGNTLLSTSSTYSFTVTATTTVYAQFAADPHMLTTTANSGGSVGGDSGMSRTMHRARCLLFLPRARVS